MRVSLLERISRFVKDENYRFLKMAGWGWYDRMEDEEFLKRKFLSTIGEKLDLENPQTFNAKLQWLKLYDRRPEYTALVDKYEVKQIVSERLGAEYVIPTLGVWDRFEDIDFSVLPDQFVLKCTHDSGGLAICSDKMHFDKSAAKIKLRRSMKNNYFYTGREWPYKNVTPRIIAETYMEDPTVNDLKDYKFLCFGGKVKCSFVCTDRFAEKGLHITFFDRDWNVLPFERHYPHIKEGLPKPESYEIMVALAERLAEDIPFVRVDFYEVAGKVFFGEMTFYPGNGFEEFDPPEWDKKLGDWIVLPRKRTE